MRYLSDAARTAMSAGAKKARSNDWGLKRKPRAHISIDADVAETFCATVPPRDRRRVATGAIATAIGIYKARRHKIPVIYPDD